MRLLVFALLGLVFPAIAEAQIRLSLAGDPLPAIEGGWPACDADDIPDAPARALRLADGSVQLYASDQTNRVNAGPDLRHLRHECAIVYRGAWNDDPAAFDDRTWIAAPWTSDGRTIWAILHDEFHGHRRPALCRTGRYMDCWYNALTFAQSSDGGRSFHREANALVAALPYRYDQVGFGHHGYFNPSNIVRSGQYDYMFIFATQTLLQREGNCLLRSANVPDPAAWRAWQGSDFDIRFVDPYTEPANPAEHVCAPVGVGALRWPVTSLVHYAATGTFIALMQDTSRQGGVFYATSSDLLYWSAPKKILAMPGLKSWICGDPAPIAYPSLIDPASTDRNFETADSAPLLYATRFEVEGCDISRRRTLMTWPIHIEPRDDSR